MKMCSFSRKGVSHPGLVIGRESGPATRILDLKASEVVSVLGFAPECLEDIVASHMDAVRTLENMNWPDSACVVRSSVRLLAPFHVRSKVIGVARNFRSAIVEQNGEMPTAPFWFAKMPNTVIGFGDTIKIDADAGNVTYEAEVGIVLGKRAKNVSESDAATYIAGFTLVNDLGATSIIQADKGNFLRGKNLDGFFPMGPYFVSADEIPDPHNLRITMEIDGEKRQDGNTSDMIFNMYALVSALSRTMTLEPGDVIASGTPAGAAAMHTPPAWLRPGQAMRVRVEGMGELENSII